MNHESKCHSPSANQTLDEIEVIAIDDCSTNDSLSILLACQEDMPNLTVLHNEKNLGLSATRNRGLEHARGEYIGFVDSDDMIDPLMYQEMYEKAKENGEPEIVTTWIKQIKSDATFEDALEPAYSRSRLIDLEKDKNEVYWINPSVCNKIFRRDIALKRRFIEGIIYEDGAYTYTSLLSSKYILELSSHYYFYRSNPEGIMASSRKINPCLTDIFYCRRLYRTICKRVWKF